mmetsp:Transcript_18809/g.29648  ORF Transcript_18809/g.29648 Transcript_18809/m.29648 type:complete len:301 (-) Transcript_18809:122-1024(-)
MAKSKKGKKTFGESCIFYGAIFGALMCFGSAIPFIPWRYARVDTNVGDRFVMERRYTLMGLSNNFGKQEGWLSMSKKIQRKVEEFGRPSPLTAILGTVTQMGGVGGAAIGCAMWTICKEHINVRYLQYYNTGGCGIAAMAMLVLGAMAAGGTVLMMNFEEDDGKKKKKKKKDEGFAPSTKTMIASIIGFLFPACAVTMFICLTGSTLNTFKETAYYPYAGAHVGGFVGGLGAFINWVVMMICINRVCPFCGKKKVNDSDDEMQQPMMGEYGGGPPGYGPPPGAYGGPPPGAYGPPPGGGY